MSLVNDFFTADEKLTISSAIEEAEKNTSGEIRVHLEQKCSKDSLQRAEEVFRILKMHKTNQRNGVLIYLAIEDRKFAIYGDEGIHTKVPDNFWGQIKIDLAIAFKKGNYSFAVSSAIANVGKQLKELFPVKSDNIDELPNEISFS